MCRTRRRQTDVGCEVVADDAAKKHETVPDAVADDVSDSRVIGSRDRDVITLSRRATRPIVIDFSSLASSAHRRALPSSNQHCSLGMARFYAAF